jgi:ribosomal protein L11 methylase PrmA
MIASGILDFKAGSVVNALERVGIGLIDKKQENDWVTLVGQRNKQPSLERPNDYE